jgi:hypothetical protein
MPGVNFASSKLRKRTIQFTTRKLLAMKHALVKFRVHLLGSLPFVVYTGHAPLLTATQPPQLPPRMARWLSFFSEYNFTVEYRPGRLNVLADALSHSGL